MPFTTSQHIFNLNNNASGIEIITTNPQKVRNIEDTIIQNIHNNSLFTISDWQLENGALLNVWNIKNR